MKLLAQKLSRRSLKILYEQGYILAYKFDTGRTGHPSIKIALKWDAATKSNAIKESEAREPPGLRRMRPFRKMPRVMNGLGIAIVSTSKGIMTDAKARKENVGGEVLCYITNRKSLKNNTMSRIGRLPVNLPAGVTVDGSCRTTR